MRTTKIMSFSVPPDFEKEIQFLAKREHRTISEFLREAVRQYIAKNNLEAARLSVAERLVKAGITEKDVEDAISKQRERT